MEIMIIPKILIIIWISKIYKFQCSEQCGSKINQNNVCITQCEDGIVIDQCEDSYNGNDIPYYSCYQCQFKFSEGCIQCQSNQCKQFDHIYLLDYQTGACFKQDNDDQNIDFLILLLEQITKLRYGQTILLLIIYVFINVGMDLEIINIKNEIMGTFMEEMDVLLFVTVQCLDYENYLSICTYIKAPKINLNILTNTGNSLQVVESTFLEKYYLQFIFIRLIRK
ncbi:unnamed protein product [Paramecium octaurelia]|uniref:Uncharacterized protein n=1 Tax=Paramecium octaurelia TaxID=43137 RepID=A0A8S1YNQ6_PAROT|nr:unnamed protein product [Paramecium octaurelia]